MLKIKQIDHVAICRERHRRRRREVQGGLRPRGHASARRWRRRRPRRSLLPIGDSNIELISPRGNDGLAKFLEKRGPGLHHIAVEVEGIEEALALLKGLGVPLIDEAPRVRGARAQGGVRAPEGDRGGPGGAGRAVRARHRLRREAASRPKVPSPFCPAERVGLFSPLFVLYLCI